MFCLELSNLLLEGSQNEAVAATLCIAHKAFSQGTLGSLADSHPFTGFYDGGGHGGHDDSCEHDPFVPYQRAQNEFYKRLYPKLAAHVSNNFVFSPYNIWLSLAALAEGADPSVRAQEFNYLQFSQLRCMREKFYDIARYVGRSNRGVKLKTHQMLLIDTKSKVNNTWAKYVMDTVLLDVDLAPIKSDPRATETKLEEFLGKAHIAYTGNSILINALDYEGLWTTAFPDASTYQAPFYNDAGQVIGSVEMMKTRMRVRFGHVPFTTTRFVELPVGNKGQYSMFIAIGTGTSVFRNTVESFLGSVFNLFSLLKKTVVPIEIAIPKFEISSAIDMTPTLDEIGIDWYWKDPAATRYVSTPPAMPGSLIQQVSVKFDNAGVNPPPSHSKGPLSGLINIASNVATDIASAVGQDFKADGPFMFALFDTKSHTCLFAGAFSKPSVLQDGEF